MAGDERSLELEIEVAGAPEDVWRAIATGPGISAWYVPHVVEEHEGGAAVASFGPEPEMQVPGRVAVWDPPHRVVFDGGERGGLAFEWRVEARRGGTCLVRLVTSGFGSGEEWDDQYDAMSEGWQIFLLNLSLHLEHFAGQRASSALASAQWPCSSSSAWVGLLGALGVPSDVAVGDRVDVRVAAGPSLGGMVAAVAPRRLALVLDQPCPGTAFVAAEGRDAASESTVSVWAYLYGPGADALAGRAFPRWRRWLAERPESGTDATSG